MEGRRALSLLPKQELIKNKSVDVNISIKTNCPKTKFGHQESLVHVTTIYGYDDELKYGVVKKC